MPKAITTIEIDYSRYGYSKRITVPLFKRERTVEAGDRVKVVGDDVPERAAVVTAVLDGGRKAVLEFDDSLGEAPDVGWSGQPSDTSVGSTPAF